MEEQNKKQAEYQINGFHCLGRVDPISLVADRSGHRLGASKIKIQW